MKNILKYFVLIICFCFMLPGMVDAATLSISGESKENTGSYDIKYIPDANSENPGSITLEVSTINTEIKYSISSSFGTCDNNLKCTIITTTIDTETVIATLKAENKTSSIQKDNIVLNGTISGVTKSIELKAGNTTTTTTTTQKVLNKDATLSGLTVSTGTFDQTFSKDIMEYSITGIKDTVNSINITPNCDNNCSWSITCPTGGCSVSSTRKVTLQNGANKVAVNVVSEDGSANKTYILNIYRGEVVTSSAYLEELKIKDGKLSPNFDPMVNDYSIEVGIDVEELEIITTTEDPNAEVVIKGNEKLVEGENTITITITSSDGESKQVYTILVNKLAEEEEKESVEKVPTTKVEKKENNTLLIVLLSVLGLGLIIVVFLIIFKKKKNKKNKNDKNDKNNKSSGKVEEVKSAIEDENTETLNILKETKDMFKEEHKDDIDEALDDLMKTKRLELGDLDF